jgi:formylglycine-generating enzyme required for sulfatase activity
MSIEDLASRYEIHETKVGGESIVYRATDPNLGRDLAIKAPDERTMADPRRLERFVEEGRKLARIHHDNVLRVHQFHSQGEIDERCYLVTDWMDMTLEEVLEERRLDPNAALDILRKIASGLRAIHAAGIVHRDLKADNILMSRAGDRLVIGDLGIASDVGAGDTLVGTPKYMAPEVHDEGTPVDVRSDVYSLGFIAYELLLGRERFRSEFSDVHASETAEIQRLKWINWHRDRARTARPLHEIDPDIPLSVSEIVARMLNKDPAARPASLDTVLRGLGVAPAADDESPIRPIALDPKAPRSKLRTWLGVAGAGVALVLAVLGFLFFGAHQKGGDFDRAVASSEAMWAARESAAEAGAETPEVRAWRDGELLRENATEFVEAESYGEAADEFEEATLSFERAREAATARAASGVVEARARAVAALTRHYDAGIDKNDLRLEPGLVHFRRAEEELTYEAFAEAAESFDAAAVALDNIGSVAPPGTVALSGSRFQAGSTPEELSAALAICRQYQPDCAPEWYASERLREVEIGPIAIQVHEVSVGDFRRFVEATGYETSAERRGYAMSWDGRGWVHKSGLSWKSNVDDDSLPVATVSAADAEAYCAWAEMRLPTEEEWEFAARGTDRRIYPWGDSWDEERIHWKSGATTAPAPVGQYASGATPEGVFDLAGNVWEWTASTDGNERVLKGGSFDENNPANLRSAARRLSAPESAHPDDGFRCVGDLDR